MKSHLSSKLSVNLTLGGDAERANAFSDKLGIEVHHLNDVSQLDTPYVLCFSQRGVALHSLGKGSPGPVSASFEGGKSEHRRKFGGGKGQLIAKAVGLKSGVYPHILDATAGLGKDAYVLASLGCSVTMVERSPVVAELLASALNHVASGEVAEICARMSLIESDAQLWLTNQHEAVADVIYLDPMYPHREKSSLVKKEMRIFQDLVGGDTDSSLLLQTALSKARYRVVVKRPRKGDALEGPKPTLQLSGKSTRYDIYTIKSMAELKADARS